MDLWRIGNFTMTMFFHESLALLSGQTLYAIAPTNTCRHHNIIVIILLRCPPKKKISGDIVLSNGSRSICLMIRTREGRSFSIMWVERSKKTTEVLWCLLFYYGGTCKSMAIRHNRSRTNKGKFSIFWTT